MNTKKRQHPKKHHFLPVWYLAGFTPSGHSRDYLWVYDLMKGRVWKSLPKTVAYQSDLYTVNSGPTEPEFFECELAKRDDIHSKLIKKVCKSRTLTSDDLTGLLGFMALIYTRSPYMRADLNHLVQQDTGLPLEKAIHDPENWRWLAEFLDVPLPNVSALVEEYTQPKEKTQLWHVLLLDVLLDLMLPLLKTRQWSLCFSHDEDNFVCSNTPLAITWPLEYPLQKSPTLGDNEAILTFPLDRHTALVSGLGEYRDARDVSRDAVAEVNSQTLLSLKIHRVNHGFVFAPTKEFYYMGNDGLLQVSGAEYNPVGDS